MAVGDAISTNTDELNALTDAYVKLKGGKLWDTYFKESAAVTHFWKNKKGLSEVVPGGKYFELPGVFGGVFGRSYGRAETSITRTQTDHATQTGVQVGSYAAQIAAKPTFQVRHIIASAMIKETDEAMQAGDADIVNITQSKVDAAIKTYGELMAKSLYWAYGTDYGTTPVFDGALMCCTGGANPHSSQGNYGGIAYNAFTAWSGLKNTDAVQCTFSKLRTIRQSAKVGGGGDAKPDFCAVHEDLMMTLLNIADTLVTAKPSDDVLKWGFTNLVYGKMLIVEDDFCPANHAVLLNSAHWGLMMLAKGDAKRTPWKDLPDSPNDKFMDILGHGNWVTDSRNAHIVATSLTA